MRYNKKTSRLIFSFLISAAVCACTVAAFMYYIPFSNETAGSYAVATIFGDPIKTFLIKILSVVAALIAFAVFIIKSNKKRLNASLFPGFTIAFGILWMILPLLSAYTLSRFTVNLIIQTVSGIAIIANVVFMMLSMCFAGIAAVDLIHCILITKNRETRANCIVMAICGILFGAATSVFLSSALQSALGLSYVFVIFGAAVLITGILSAVFNGFKQNTDKEERFDK